MYINASLVRDICKACYMETGLCIVQCLLLAIDLSCVITSTNLTLFSLQKKIARQAFFWWVCMQIIYIPFLYFIHSSFFIFFIPGTSTLVYVFFSLLLFHIQNCIKYFFCHLNIILLFISYMYLFTVAVINWNNITK